jgi:hypothetical protein
VSRAARTATSKREDAKLPSLVPVRQRLFSRPIENLPVAVHHAVDVAITDENLKPGSRIAVTAGSRGIANIAQIFKAAVDRFRQRGAEPFIVPAMGSRGGAAAEGRAKLFYVDAHVAAADGILVINRVKAYTDFSGPHESGLMKMITIGLGKRAQAERVHAHGVWGLRELMPEVARAKLKRAPILGGLAILEDGYEQTTEIVGLPAERIDAEEPKLLARARQGVHGPPALRRTGPADRGLDGQRDQRDGDGHQCHRPQAH